MRHCISSDAKLTDNQWEGRTNLDLSDTLFISHGFNDAYYNSSWSIAFEQLVIHILLQCICLIEQLIEQK